MTRSDAGRPDRRHDPSERSSTETIHLANSIVRIQESERVGLVAQIERCATGQTPNPEYAKLACETAEALREVANA